MAELRAAAESDQSEFVALYGRRRVGKTFLVGETFNDSFAFHHAGMEGSPKRIQLESFREALRKHGHAACPRLTSWIRAFSELETLLEGLPRGKKTVFLDELPWYDTPKSGFLPALESFWNGWACLRKDILLIVCGSATSWIVEKVLRNRGGLYNRVTRRLPVAPFSLAECEEYARYKHLGFDRRQIAECYMAFGGVAWYWSLLREGLSAAQNFDRLFFGESDELRGEYGRLFSSLFKRPSKHIEIVELLGRKKCGMTRTDIVEGLGGSSGGDISTCLEELCQCGFLRRYDMIGRVKKDATYQLIDNFVLFHFQFIRGRRGHDDKFWTLSYASPAANTWRGLAFERLCLWHLPQIRKALGISGVRMDAYSWRGGKVGAPGGNVQIDLLLDRGDNMVDICEMKFSGAEYELDADESRKLANRVEAFRRATGTRKGVRTVLITTYGLANGKHSGEIGSVVTLDDLFAE